MFFTMSRIPSVRQSPAGDVLADLAEAMRLTRHTYDSLAAHLSERLGQKLQRGDVWRLLNGERPWKHAHESALPDDMAGAYYEIRAQRFGRLVVEPAEGTELDALKSIVSAVMRAMQIRPTPAKAELRELKKAVNE